MFFVRRRSSRVLEISMRPALMRPAFAVALLLLCTACSGFWSDKTEPTTMRTNPPRSQKIESADDPQTPTMMRGTTRNGPGPAGTACGVTSAYPC
jgi:hypothetical protein